VLPPDASGQLRNSTAETLTESDTDRYSSQSENNYFTELCSGSEAGWYLRLRDFMYHSTLGLRVIKKKKKNERVGTLKESCRAISSSVHDSIRSRGFFFFFITPKPRVE